MPAKFAKKVFKTSNNNANDVPPPTLNDVDDSAAAIVDAFAEINEEHQPKQQLQQTQQQVQQNTTNTNTTSSTSPRHQPQKQVLASNTDRFFDEDATATALDDDHVLRLSDRKTDTNQQQRQQHLSPEQTAQQEKSLSQLYLEHQQQMLKKRHEIPNNSTSTNPIHQNQNQNQNQMTSSSSSLLPPPPAQQQHQSQMHHQQNQQQPQQQSLLPLPPTAQQLPPPKIVEEPFVLGECPRAPIHPQIVALHKALAFNDNAEDKNEENGGPGNSSSSSAISFIVNPLRVSESPLVSNNNEDSAVVSSSTSPNSNESQIWRKVQGLEVNPRPRDLANPILNVSDIKKCVPWNTNLESTRGLQKTVIDDILSARLSSFSSPSPSSTSSTSNRLPPVLQHTLPEICKGTSLSAISSANGCGYSLLHFFIAMRSVFESLEMEERGSLPEGLSSRETFVTLFICPSRELELDALDSFRSLLNSAIVGNDTVRNCVELHRGLPASDDERPPNIDDFSDEEGTDNDDVKKQKKKRQVISFVNASRYLCPLDKFTNVQHLPQGHEADRIITDYEKTAKAYSTIRSVIFISAEKFTFMPFLSSAPHYEMLMRIPFLLEPPSIPFNIQEKVRRSGGDATAAEAEKLLQYFDSLSFKSRHNQLKRDPRTVQWIFTGGEQTRTSHFIDAFESCLLPGAADKQVVTRFSFQSPTIPTFEYANRWSRIAHVSEFIPRESIFCPNGSSYDQREFSLLLQIIQRTPPPIAIVCWSNRTVADLKAELEKVFAQSKSRRSSSSRNNAKIVTDDPVDFSPRGQFAYAASTMTNNNNENDQDNMNDEQQGYFHQSKSKRRNEDDDFQIPWILVSSDNRIRDNSNCNVLPKFNHVINFEIPLMGKDTRLFLEFMTMRAQLLGDHTKFSEEKRLPLMTTILSGVRYKMSNLMVFSDFLKTMRLPVPPMLVTAPSLAPQTAAAQQKPVGVRHLPSAISAPSFNPHHSQRVQLQQYQQQQNNNSTTSSIFTAASVTTNQEQNNQDDNDAYNNDADDDEMMRALDAI